MESYSRSFARIVQRSNGILLISIMGYNIRFLAEGECESRGRADQSAQEMKRKRRISFDKMNLIISAKNWRRNFFFLSNNDTTWRRSDFTIVIVQFLSEIPRHLWKSFLEKYQGAKNFLAGHYLLTPRRRDDGHSRVTRTSRASLDWSMRARAHLNTQKLTIAPFFSIKVGKGERKILEKSEQENVAGDFYRLSLFIVSLGWLLIIYSTYMHL